MDPLARPLLIPRRQSSASLLLVVPILIAACTGSSAPTSAPSRTPEASPVPSTATQRVTPAPTGANGEGQIVFEDWMINAGRHQLYMDSLDGTGSRSLVHSSFDDARPALSPDGKQVLFVRMGDGTDKLMVVNTEGSEPQNLGDGACGDLCNGAENPEWSPDGRRIVFKHAFFDDDGTFVKIGILIVDLERGGATEVTMHKAGADHKLKAGDDFEDIEPDWSPDGKRLAFARIDNASTPHRIAIFTVGIDGKGLRQVTPWALGASEPNWSPDGNRIAFNVPGEPFAGGEQNIFTIRPDGTEMRQLTEHLEMGEGNVQGTFDPSWSPDGSQLIFTHFPSTNGLADLYVVNSDGTGLHVFARTRLMNESHAVWGVSPGS